MVAVPGHQVKGVFFLALEHAPVDQPVGIGSKMIVGPVLHQLRWPPLAMPAIFAASEVMGCALDRIVSAAQFLGSVRQRLESGAAGFDSLNVNSLLGVIIHRSGRSRWR